MPWSRAFDDPVPLPDGGELRSLRDARDYIAKLPNFVISTPRWLAAITALVSVVVYGGDTMLPRVGIIRALYPRETEPRPHKKRSIKFRIVRGSSKEIPRLRAAQTGDQVRRCSGTTARARLCHNRRLSRRFVQN